MTDMNELRNDTHLDSIAKRILATIDRSKVDDHELMIFTEYLRDEQVKQKPTAVEPDKAETAGPPYQVANRGIDLTIRFPSPASFGIFVEWLFARTGAESFCEYSKKREQRCAIGKLTPCYVNSLANVNDARQYNQFLSSRLVVAEPAEDSGEIPVTNKMTVGSACVSPHPTADALVFREAVRKPRQQIPAQQRATTVDLVAEAKALSEEKKKKEQAGTIDEPAMLKDILKGFKVAADKTTEKKSTPDKAATYDPSGVDWYPKTISDVVSVRELIIDRLSHLSVSVNVMLSRFQEGKGEQWDAPDFLADASPDDPMTLLDLRYTIAMQLLSTELIELCEQYLADGPEGLPVDAWLNRLTREFQRLQETRLQST